MQYKAFTSLLMKWHRDENKRQMPWKGVKDPYKVWLSEVILQQTRVEQGLPYYARFIKKYPSISALAKANDEEVFKLWEGLGYYSRCRNLLLTARKIVNEFNGVFPKNYDAIVSMKGIGAYTAAAIASFSFGLPYAVLDGNVFRVLSRIFCIDLATDSTAGRRYFTGLAAKVLDKNDPGEYNQAIMDFGATVCKPVVPACSACSLRVVCKAYKTGNVNLLPVKEKMIQRRSRWFTYFIFYHGNKVLVHKRTSKDIWQNLHEFFLVESPADPHWTKDSLADFMKNRFAENDFLIFSFQQALRQQLTHQVIQGYFIEIEISSIAGFSGDTSFKWIDKNKINELAFPGFINQHIKNKKAAPAIL